MGVFKPNTTVHTEGIPINSEVFFPQPKYMLGFNAKVNIFAYVLFFSQPKYMLGFNVKVNIFAYVSLANRSFVGHIFEDDESHLFYDYLK